MHAYDGSALEEVGTLVGSASVLVACWALCETSAWRRLPDRVVELAVAPGGMTLTLYILQVAILHAYGLAWPGQPDDHWWMLALLCGSALILAWGWRAMTWTPFGRRLPRGLQLGPIEGIEHALIATVRG